jgi:hypothetical protein
MEIGKMTAPVKLIVMVDEKLSAPYVSIIPHTCAVPNYSEYFLFSMNKVKFSYQRSKVSHVVLDF